MRVAQLAALVVVCTACGSRPPLVSPTRYHRAIPATAYAHYLRGRLEMHAGRPRQAAQEFRLAMAATPDEPEPAVALIDALLASGDLAEADQLAQTARTGWAEHAGVWYASGLVWGTRRKYGAAAEAFAHAVALEPERERYYLALTTAWQKAGEPARERSAFEQLLAHNARSVTGHFRYGVRSLAWGDLPGAEKHLRRAIELNPDHVGARIALADVLRRAGRSQEADMAARELFLRTRGHPGTTDRIVIDALDWGGSGAALHLLQLLDTGDSSAVGLIALGRLYRRLGHHDQALAAGRAALLQAPDEPDAMLLVGESLAALGQVEQAIQWLTAEAAAEPGLVAAGSAQRWSAAVRIAADSGQPDRALELADRALGKLPDEAVLGIAHAYARELAGSPDRARMELRHWLTRNPRNPQLLFAWALLERRTDHPGRAIALARRAVTANPNYLPALILAGEGLADSNTQLARAETLLRRALQLAPRDGLAMAAWGWLLFRRGQLAPAQQFLERAARLNPTEPRIWLRLGELYLATGRPPAARNAWNQARSLHPTGEVTRRIEALRNDLGDGR